MKLKHFFLPHPDTHSKAHLLGGYAIGIYILLFILLQALFSIISDLRPGILGVNSQITALEIVDKTNKEREKMGLSKLTFNTTLSQAAEAKAFNMFEENYWSHFSPSGKDPWGFINARGYKFSYAGENLARNFTSSDEVVTAWMNSPTHKENIVNSKYQDIGVAVLEGVLDGQKTTLIVQMFGKPYEALAAQPTITLSGKSLVVDQKTQEALSRSYFVAGSKEYFNQAMINPYEVTRGIGFGITILLGTLLLIDMVVLKRRGVFRFSSHHLAHLSLLILLAFTLGFIGAGSIL